MPGPGCVRSEEVFMSVWLRSLLTALAYLVALAVGIGLVAGYYYVTAGLPSWPPVVVIVFLTGLVLLWMRYLGVPAASALAECLRPRPRLPLRRSRIGESRSE
jgi:hypothetical protein